MNTYICTLLNNDKEKEVLVCNDSDFVKLVTHIDSDRYRLIDIQIMVEPVSYTVLDYLKENKNLETGNTQGETS